MKKANVILAAGVLMAFIGGAVLASVTFTPPGDGELLMATVKLVGQKAAPKASGTATLICNKPNTKRAFTIEARGLDTRKVYTMWLIRTVKKGGKSKKEMLGLGKAPHVLKVDKKGKAKFVYNPKDCPDITRWQQLKIVEHKDKNAKNMKKIAPVLVGDLTKLKS